mgnify:CR=1 FL=1
MAVRKRRRAAKRNPMPTHGALFVTNGKRRRKSVKNRKSASKRKGTGLAAIRRAFGLKANGSRRRKANTRRRTRKNSLAIVSNRRRRTRRNGLTVMSNRRRTRRNSLTVMANRRRRTRKNGLTRRLRRNSGGMIGRLGGTARGFLAKIPLVGSLLATYAGPALFGALVVEPIRLVLKYGGKYLPAHLQRFGFTLGSLLVAVIVGFLPISKEMRKSLGMAAVTAGGAIDFYRYRTGITSLGDDYGDGGEYSVVPYSDGDVGALMADYADADFADADFAGIDFDGDEGDAALAGPGAWRGRFRPGPHHGIRRGRGGGQPSRHAGKKGGQWAWLIKLVGYSGFQQIVKLPPSQRIAVIADLKKSAKASLPNLLTQNADAGEGDLSGYAGDYADLYAMQG